MPKFSLSDLMSGGGTRVSWDTVNLTGAGWGDATETPQLAENDTSMRGHVRFCGECFFKSNPAACELLPLHLQKCKPPTGDAAPAKPKPAAVAAHTGIITTVKGALGRRRLYQLDWLMTWWNESTPTGGGGVTGKRMTRMIRDESRKGNGVPTTRAKLLDTQLQDKLNDAPVLRKRRDFLKQSPATTRFTGISLPDTRTDAEATRPPP